MSQRHRRGGLAKIWKRINDNCLSLNIGAKVLGCTEYIVSSNYLYIVSSVCEFLSFHGRFPDCILLPENKVFPEHARPLGNLGIPKLIIRRFYRHRGLIRTPRRHKSRSTSSSSYVDTALAAKEETHLSAGFIEGLAVGEFPDLWSDQ